MTDKVQLIKEEILRRKQSWQHSDKQYEHGGKDVCDYLLGFIDSIPEEHNEGLEEEIKCYIKKEFPDGIGFPNVPKIARHFAEWQEKKMLGIAEAFYQQGRHEQEQEMMKDAVELHIVESFNPVETEDKKLHGFTALYYNAEFPDFYPITGQTIKVIPTKEIQQ